MPVFHFLRFSDIFRRRRIGTYTHLQYCLKKTLDKKLKNSTVKIAEIDSTLRFTKKIQKIYRPRKKKKFTDKEYFQIYPSHPMPPGLYGIVKTHKPEKNYPMRSIASTKED